jgi:very-short-patch-repair endonuclease
MVTIDAELAKARESLLDLTMRNRLLNYRQTVRSIRITGELPAEVYDALVLREKTLQFRARSRQSLLAGTLLDRHVSESTGAPQIEEWRPRADDLETHHTDKYLDTPYDDESLQKKLFRVYHEGHSAVEEQGYTVVHIAIGFLEWYEEDQSDQPRRAPLILIPVELERVRAGDFSNVTWTGEDVFANISLIAKVAEQGVAVPAFEPSEEKSGIDAWLQQVVDAVTFKPRWRVLSEMHLDFFSFTKFVMFKDLDPATWPPERKATDHPLLKSLFNPQGVQPSEEGFDESEIDRKLTARDLWHVRDADPSQIAVVEDVKAGRNLVVQGPPGTGKSQTITNVIAETLAAGKTVLFVSEKMAALEVVKSRLDEAGLGPFCLELHSRKANKKAVLLELQRALQSQSLPPVSDRLLDEHELLKNELNRYASDLATPVGKLARTPFQLFGEKQQALAHFEAAHRAIPPLPRIANASSLGEPDVAAALKALRDVSYAIPLVRPVEGHPWRHSAFDTMLPHEEEDLRALLALAQLAVRDTVDAAVQLASVSGARQPLRLADIERALSAADVIACATSPTETTLLLSAEWNAPNEIARTLIHRVETLQRERTALAHTFTDDAMAGDLSGDVEDFRPLAAKLFRVFNGGYRALRKRLATNYRGSAPRTAQMVSDLTQLVHYQRSCRVLRSDATGVGLFGSRWQADTSDCPALRLFAEWIVAFRRELLSDALTEDAIALASQPRDLSTIGSSIDRLRNAAADLAAQLDALARRVRLNADAAFAEPLASVSLDSLAGTLGVWHARVSDLFRWAQFNGARVRLRSTAAAPLETLISEDRLEAEDVLPFFRAAVAESLLRDAFGERASLGGFVGDLHERKIARFREIDADLVRVNQARLSRRLHDRRPQISGGATRNSEGGILLGEFNRKRGHMPIRKLLANAGTLVQRIKPCFLMSPLSIAQFLDPRSARFDLIVFDEASQVRPEDAVGALLRGNQLVVMGDTQQLPPTSFFDHLVESDDDDADADEPASASVSDVESILHQCARSYPTKMLNWHYRSRHESLIAVSNLHFYDNRLQIYPSVLDTADEIGLHFKHLPRSVYDRGRSSTNRIEAQAVAAAAIDHYRRRPDRSLGIGTFNIKQQQAILEEIELQLKTHPEMEAAFKSDRREHFFVKNLETIQGDERDVILISVGYGRDASGKLSMNFGPVNRDGGERRLNVLMSRAREKCVVFSNFTAADLPVEATTSKGIVTLKSFLEYAQTRQLTDERRPQDDSDSPFEDAVAEVLRAHGHEVRQQVGCAGFRVDLAIVDPDARGRYLLGIECDGAKYHSSPVARDRDRLRQQILENLGWTICRIWSTDWYRNRPETINRVLRTVEEARKAPRKEVKGSPARPSTPNASSFIADQYNDPPPDPTDPVEQIRPAPSSDSGLADIPVYEVCRSLRISRSGDLHLVPAELLALAVEDVVRVEGPVHIDEIVRRIRTIWGLHRAGNRIHEAIERGAYFAARRRTVERDGEFLTLPNAPIHPRRRSGDRPPRIDLIYHQEITEAIKHVLRAQFATTRDELIVAATRRLGIQATSEEAAARVNAVINEGMEREWFATATGRIELKE